jgi:4,5-dihydroxyphthalate decarboxylase
MTTTLTDVPTLRTNLADYAVTKAMKDGRVTSDIVNLDYCGPTPAHNGFKAMVRESKFDAGELAIVTFLQAKAYGKPYVLLPTPISGRFQHHCAGFNIEFGDLKPKDIEGKKVGVRTYTQTTALWIRGILRHEYGVDLDKVQWMTLGDGHLAEYRDPNNCERLPAGSSIPEMMLKGELAAALLGEDMPKDERVRTLVPNAQAAAKDWFARENVVPINHMFVVHEDISKQRPDVVRELYRMVVESRNLAEGVPAVFPPIGLEANRKGLQLAIDWALDQKIIPHRLSVDEMFDDVTGSLG